MTGEVLLALRIILGVSIFAFLGWVLWLLWNELKIQAGLLSTLKVPPLSLTVQTTDKSPVFLSFTQAEITLGRDPACECLLDDDAVSSHHARLSYHQIHWWLEDLDSKNGTRLNQEILTTPTVVISGDRISCGHSVITVQFNQT